jgi:hypothetical protein
MQMRWERRDRFAGANRARFSSSSATPSATLDRDQAIEARVGGAEDRPSRLP